MLPTEKSQESSRMLDLTGVPAPVPPQLVEIFGQEPLTRVEALAKSAVALAEFTQIPDPFMVEAGPSETLIDDQTRQTMGEVDTLNDVRIEGMADPSFSLKCRKQSPILRSAAARHKQLIKDSFLTGAMEIRSVGIELTIVDTTDSEDVLAKFPGLHSSLETIASGLASNDTFDSFQTVLEYEARLRHIDGASSVLQRDPALHSSLINMWDEIVKIEPESLANKMTEEFCSRLTDAGMRGERLLEVRRAHRIFIATMTDQGLARSMVKEFDKLRSQGSMLHLAMNELVRGMANEQLEGLFLELREMREAFTQHLSEHGGSTNGSTDESTLAAEAYIADKADFVESVIRQLKIKTTKESRRGLNELQDRGLQRSQKRIARVAIQPETNPFEDIETDNDFRRQCRDSRDILVGGRRLDHPKARQLADELHRLKFGKGGKVSLDPAESGTLVAIATDRLATLIKVVNRFETSTESRDVQVSKMERDLPEQFAILRSFNLDQVLEKLQLITSDLKDSLKLLSALHGSITSEQLRGVVKDLITERAKRRDELITREVPTEIQTEDALQESEKLDSLMINAGSIV